MRSLLRASLALFVLAPAVGCGDDSTQAGGGPEGGTPDVGGAPAGGGGGGGDGGAGGQAGGESVLERTFVGTQADVQTSIRETTHADGSRSIHGETRGDLSDYFLGELALLEAVEDAELDATGRLVSADLRHRLSYNDNIVVERRVVVDGAAGTVAVTRPNGELTQTYPTEHPLVPIVFNLSSIIPLPLVSAAECAILQGAERAGSQNLNIDTIYTFDFLSETSGTGMPAASLLYGDVSCDYDVVSGDLTGLSSVSWGEFADEAGAADLVEAIDVAAATQVITPQVCAAPARFSSFEVLSGSSETIHGQLDLPEGTGPFPVVIFSSGSGGSDREANYFGAPQWTCLSEALVNAGIAVARYDDPGHGESTGSFYALSYTDRDLDVSAVAGVVAGRAEVNAGAVFLLGHSEGGDHSSRAAIATPEVTGLILVAGLATPIPEAPVSQRALLHSNAGYSQDLADALQASWQTFVDATLAGTLTPAQAAPNTVEYWEQRVVSDGAADAVAAARPTLVIHGDGDWQVAPSDADVFEAAFEGTGIDFEVQRFADLGHFQTHNAPGYVGFGEEYGLPVAFDAVVENAIIAWVASHTP